MCGLVGIAGDCSGPWKDLFSELLMIDAVRGTHSTGAGFVARTDGAEFETVKRPGHPFNLFAAPEYEKATANANSVRAIIGHNRYATVGEKNEQNAHPFKFAKIMGAHNGTLDNWALKSLKDWEKYGTDSEAIFASINDIGPQETLALISGAWALTWYDKADNTLNFLRNSSRPLHYCYSKDRSTIIWASEAAMLRYIMSRRNRTMFIPAEEKDHDGIFSVTSDTHYKWALPKYIVDAFGSPERTELKGKSWVSGTHWLNNRTPKKQHNHSPDPYAYAYGYDVADEDLPFLARPSSSKFRPPYKDAGGKVLNKGQVSAMFKEGCCFCGNNGQDWGEFIKVMGHYVDRHTPYACEECYNDIDKYEYTKWVA